MQFIISGSQLVNFLPLFDLHSWLSTKNKSLVKIWTWLVGFLLYKLLGLVQACTSANKSFVETLM